MAPNVNRPAVTHAPVFLVMGVSGSGKTTIAQRLAAVCHGLSLDADDFHSEVSKTKMHRGEPLTDADRAPWLDRLNRELRDAVARGTGQAIFLACSALKQRYRDQLAAGVPELRVVYLRGSPELIQGRVEHRQHHFMPARLLASQFADLEEPSDAIVLEIGQPLEKSVERFRRAIGLAELD